MEPTLVQSIFTIWGPFGLVAVGGWYALKWLAQRDDSRNTKLVQLVEHVSNVVANNTQAVENMGRKSDILTGELSRLERSIESRFPKRKR
jgi:hypothetical protein